MENFCVVLEQVTTLVLGDSFAFSGGGGGGV